MKFYRENGVNPLGSCLPLVAQLPVFISLYYMLRTSLRVDICPATQRAHDPASSAPPTRPLRAGHGAPVPVHPGPDQQGQRRRPDRPDRPLRRHPAGVEPDDVERHDGSDAAAHDDVLPLVFVLFVIRFPAGVLVYWITTNTWTMAQQFIVKRRIGPTSRRAWRRVERRRSGGGGPGRVELRRRQDDQQPGPRPAKRDAKSRPARAATAQEARPAPLAGLLRGRAKDVEEPTTDGAGARALDRRPVRPARRRSARAGGGRAMSATERGTRGSRPRAPGADRRRCGSRGHRRGPRRRRRTDRRVSRRGARAADRPPRPDDRRDPAPRLPVRDDGRRRAQAASSSTPPATANAGRWRCARPPTRPPRRRSTIAARCRSRR